LPESPERIPNQGRGALGRRDHALLRSPRGSYAPPVAIAPIVTVTFPVLMLVAT
jgi:hypothetical protein